ncbi:winged helix-turn-helix domain-containing protein [Halorientalis salina]|uniref:winged helix-turn-helix domain-containing protein n=1 Tax=Halorientalis salina TaxID=2932266 RepID=UPI0010AB79A0|nr:helix-turn-helix domain-containing protein [Halorientalis salina]
MESSASDRPTDERTTKDAVFEALSDSTRRRVLRALDASGGSETVSGLARQLTILGSDDEPARLTAEQTLVSLLHVHLPKLRAAGLIDWDDDAVTLSEHATVLPLSRPLEGGLLSESFTGRYSRV